MFFGTTAVSAGINRYQSIRSFGSVFSKTSDFHLGGNSLTRSLVLLINHHKGSDTWGQTAQRAEHPGWKVALSRKAGGENSGGAIDSRQAAFFLSSSGGETHTFLLHLEAGRWTTASSFAMSNTDRKS